MPFPKILRASDSRSAKFSPPKTTRGKTFVVGWREWAGLPDFGIARIKGKMDTGARTSALHANSIELFSRDGAEWVRFDVTGEADEVPWHEAPLSDRRVVRSSNGMSEERCFITTVFALAGHEWRIEMSLTNRERMDLPLLVGRNALAGRVLVDADRSWLCGRPLSEEPRPGQNTKAGKART